MKLLRETCLLIFIMSNQTTPPTVLKELWSNWQESNGGGGRCADCPAHWSTRSDFSGEASERTSSFQHRPSCGDGSFDPDILIVAREPGTPNGDKLDQNKRRESLEEARNESILDSPGGTIENAKPLFERIEASEFAGAFTQLRKCNELISGDNTQARRQCAGTGDCGSGYLAEEVTALAPEYIVTLTTEGLREFCSVFNLPRYYVEDMAGGPRQSGICAEAQNESGFTWFPAPHPDHRGAHQVYNQLETDFDTDGYFDAVGRDIIEYMRSDDS